MTFDTKDAWEQLLDLQDRYIRTWKSLPDGLDRPELEVTADALDRGILLVDDHHNVGTIREYIEVLIEACDFVDAANPVWASLRHA